LIPRRAPSRQRVSIIKSSIDLDEASELSESSPANKSRKGGLKAVKQLLQGEEFGEECLVHPGSIATMSVEASGSTGCDTCTLDSESFNRLIEMHPEFNPFITARAENRLSGISILSLCAFFAVSTSLFEHAELELIEAVADAISVIHCVPGQHLIKRGTSAAGLFVVLKGACNCLIPDPEQPKVLKNVATKEPGQHFGELSLLDPGAVTAADVVAADASTTVLLLTPTSFRNICLTHEKFKGLLLASTPSYREYNFFFHLSAFRDAKHEFLIALVKRVKRITRDAGTTVQSLNDVGQGGAYFVEKGQLMATAPGARPVALNEGSFFGLETLSSDDAAAAPLQQVQAGTDVELLHLPREEAQKLMLAFPYLTRVAQTQQFTLVSSSAPPKPPAACASGAPANEGAGDAVMSAALSSAAPGDVPLDMDLLTQRITLMQASIVAMGREMRSRIDTIDQSMAEKFERKDRNQSAALSQITTRLEQLSATCDHPQRAARSSRVAFAPRSCFAASSTLSEISELGDSQRNIVNAAACSRRSSFSTDAGGG